MSAEAERPELSGHVRASSSFESDEEALEALVQLKDINLDKWFSERDTDLDSEDGEGIHISFYNETAPNHLTLHTTSESEVNVFLRLVDDDLDSSAEILNLIRDVTGSLNIREKVIYKQFEEPFDSLNLPITEDTELAVVGIRIEEGNSDYIIQKTDGDLYSVTMRNSEDVNFEDTIPEGIVVSEVEALDEFMEEEF